jgi:pyridoxamine 5'-phosphate oxidase
MMITEDKNYFQAQEARFATLDGIEQDCWEQLLRGALSSKSDFHQPVIGTISDGACSMRTVVLRQTVIAEKKLVFHTDTRSGKIADLATNNSVTWLFYSQRHRIQIRVKAKAHIFIDTPIAREIWLKTPEKSAKSYMTTQAPGTVVAGATSGLPNEFALREPTKIEMNAAVGNFAVVVTQVEWMEWLWLNKSGHRRAQFVYNDDLTFKGDWLVP